MKYSKPNFRVRITTRGLVILTAGLSILCLSVSPAHQARAYLAPSNPTKTQTSVRYYNPYEHDAYLIGVDNIVVAATHPPDAANSLGHPPKIPKIDFRVLNQKIVDQLRVALPENMKRLRVQTMFDAPLLPNRPNDENALTLNFRFGYQLVERGDRQVMLGAVYPSIERRPPENLRQDRVSGVLPTKFPPAPFLIEGDEASLNRSVLQATQRCVGNIVAWLKLFPMEMPDQGKQKH